MNFYESLINANEKLASTQTRQDIERSLAGLDEETIETIAEEIGALHKKAEETVEEKATEEARQEVSQAEVDHEAQKDESTKDGTVSEDTNKAVGEAVAENETAKEEDLTDAKKDAVASPTNADAKKDDEDYKVDGKEVTASEQLYDVLKAGADMEDHIETRAFELAEGMMKVAGVSEYDYVLNAVGNEKLANIVFEKAEKLATVTGSSLFKTANDIIEGISNIIEDNQ